MQILRIRSFALTSFAALLALNTHGQLASSVDVTPALHFTLERQRADGAFEPTNRIAWNDTLRHSFSANGTNRCRFALAPRKHPYLYRMLTPDGRDLQLTDLGKRSMVSVDPKLKLLDIDLRFFPIGSGLTYSTYGLKLADYFIPEGQGPLILELRVRVWTRKTNGTSGIVLSPPLRVLVDPPKQ